MTDTILSLLVCPLTKQHLLPPSPRLAEVLQTALDEQSLSYLDGAPVSKPDGVALRFLVSENQRHIYSVIGGVPVLLEAKQVILSV
jgi:uncharacterized protein YbaR (Trm112 family)